MSHGDIQGRARTSIRTPRAKAVCDRCGVWYQLDHLVKQMEWYGTALKWTGYLVCPETCLDKPQDQLRPLILPPDPVPVQNPRPENFANDYGLQGAGQYSLFQPVYAIQSEASVMAALAAASGVPTPASYDDISGTIAKANVSQLVVRQNSQNRNFLAIYNPSNPQLQLSFSNPAVWGVESNFILGPGEAILWSSSFGNVPTGTLSAIGLIGNVPFFAWEAPAVNPYFIIPFNGPGNLAVGSNAVIGSGPALYSIALTNPYALTVLLPAGSLGVEGPWTFKDTLGIAAQYTISVFPSLGTFIDGLPPNTAYNITNPYQSTSFAWDPYQNKYVVF